MYLFIALWNMKAFVLKAQDELPILTYAKVLWGTESDEGMWLDKNANEQQSGALPGVTMQVFFLLGVKQDSFWNGDLRHQLWFRMFFDFMTGHEEKKLWFLWPALETGILVPVLASAKNEEWEETS